MRGKKEKKGFSRRKFVVRSAVGVGVLLGTTWVTSPLWRRALADKVDKADPIYLGNTKDPVMWFYISNEGRVTLHSPKVEMGQGALTGLVQIAADELGVPIEHMDVVHAESMSGNLDQFSTGGSTTVSGLWQPLRELAATMREMLRMEAAKQMQVSADTLKVDNGTVSGNGRTLTFGEIVAHVEEWTIPKDAPLRDISEYQYVGKPVPRVDLEDKVMGAPIFGMDASLPGMLYGAVVRPTKIGARFVDANTMETVLMPGVVKVVKEKDFVGVVAETQLQAEMAKRTIKVKWETDRNWQTRDIEEMILVGKGKPIVIQKQGNSKRLLRNASEVITAEYKSPIGAHAQIEPNGAVAEVREDYAKVILSTQVVRLTRNEVADRLGLKKDQVNIVPTYLGGGFGRRLHTPHAMQAAVMARVVGKPVKYFFDRQEEFQHDTFRPPTHHVLKAVLSEDGMIEAMEHNVSSGDVMFGSPIIPDILQSILGSDAGAWRGGMIQYGAIPHHRAISWRVKLPFATSWWRSLGLLANTFAIESFMDELALKAGKDPVQFRLDHIQDDVRGFRLKEVIKAAAEKAGFMDEVHNGRAMGFAASTDANTPVAHVAEVSVEGKQIKVHKVTCAIDPGLAVNPDQVRAQCEGCVIMGMSAAMFEKMEVVDGSLRPTMYGPYKMALMKHAPKEIDVVILENDDVPGAVGEPPLGPIGAAIANAVYRLTGKRLREMPLTLEG